MPNWCATNFVLKGPEKSIKNFVDTVNSCLEKEDVAENGFGKFWLGNVCNAFGYDYEKQYGLRGCVFATDDIEPCLFGPSDDTTPLTYSVSDNEAVCKFSTVTAWGSSEWLFCLLEEKFSDCKYGYRSTDEFGNFYDMYNSDVSGYPMYEIETEDEYCGFGKGHFDEFAAKVKSLSGIEITKDDIKNGKLSGDMYAEIHDKNEAPDAKYLHVCVWREYEN